MLQVTTEWVRDLVKRSLGHPNIVLEVSDTDIETFIHASVLQLSPHYPGVSLVECPVQGNIVNLRGKRILEVIKVIDTGLSLFSLDDPFAYQAQMLGNGSLYQNFDFVDFALMQYRQAEYKNIVSPGFKYYVETETLYLDDYYSSTVTLECLKDIQVVEDIFDDGSLAWIVKYTIAQTRRTIGLIRRKFNIPNSPIAMDGESMVQEGDSAILDLDARLIGDSQSGFFVVVR